MTASIWSLGDSANTSTVHGEVNVYDYGAVGDGVTDDIEAFEAAIEALAIRLDAPYYSAKGIVNAVGGDFFCSRTLNIEHQIILRGGTGPGGNGYGSSRLIFPTGVQGIRIHSAQTSTTGKDAAGTCIEHLTVTTTRGSAAAEIGKYGIYANTKFILKSVIVSLFGDTGVYVYGETGVTGNANNWYMENCRFAENGYDGFGTEGPDANAGNAIGVDCGNNLRWGFKDSSFLGNTYTACHTNANLTGGYNTTNANAYSVFVGCYSEGGELNTINSPSLIIGGILGSAGTNTGTAPAIGPGLANILSFRRTDIRPDYGVDFTATIAQGSSTNLDAYKESSWTPAATNVTATGTPTYAGTYTRIGNRIFFEITVSTTGTNAFTGNSTYLTLPAGLVPVQLGSCVAIATNTTSVGPCYISTTGRVYLPTWAASSQTVVISGHYPVSTTA